MYYYLLTPKQIYMDIIQNVEYPLTYKIIFYINRNCINNNYHLVDNLLISLDIKKLNTRVIIAILRSSYGFKNNLKNYNYFLINSYDFLVLTIGVDKANRKLRGLI